MIGRNCNYTLKKVPFNETLSATMMKHPHLFVTSNIYLTLPAVGALHTVFHGRLPTFDCFVFYTLRKDCGKIIKFTLGNKSNNNNKKDFDGKNFLSCDAHIKSANN